MGTGLAAFDSWVAIRGIKTLGVRVEKAGKNALACAKMLEASKKVKFVKYPGLKSHPQYKAHWKNSRGGGGMLTFNIKGGLKAASTFMKSLKVFTLAESLGGVESLVNHPLTMTHSSVPKPHRDYLGIDEGLIRVSVGIEDEEDLLADLKQALAKC